MSSAGGPHSAAERLQAPPGAPPGGARDRGEEFLGLARYFHVQVDGLGTLSLNIAQPTGLVPQSVVLLPVPAGLVAAALSGLAVRLRLPSGSAPECHST